jgi:hypothetical protein
MRAKSKASGNSTTLLVPKKIVRKILELPEGFPFSLVRGSACAFL